MRVLMFAALVLVVSCGPPARVENIEVVEVVAWNSACELGEARDVGVFDLSLTDAYFAPLRFAALVNGTSTDTSAGVTGSRVFFTSDSDLILATTPRSADTARRAWFGGVASEAVTPPDIAFATLIERDVSTSLAQEPALIAVLSSAAGRARINAHVALEGGLFPQPGDAPPLDQLISTERLPDAPQQGEQADVEVSPPVFFTFPIDLCVGCPRPTCAPNEIIVASACAPGQDEPSTCLVRE
jgi:hypothetical protein